MWLRAKVESCGPNAWRAALLLAPELAVELAPPRLLPSLLSEMASSIYSSLENAPEELTLRALRAFLRSF